MKTSNITGSLKTPGAKTGERMVTYGWPRIEEITAVLPPLQGIPMYENSFVFNTTQAAHKNKDELFHLRTNLRTFITYQSYLNN